MSATAVADPQADTQTLSQDYVSSCTELRLIRDPKRKKPIGEGTDFYITDGSRVEFRNGRYTSRDPDEIEWLDNHPNHGVLFHKVGFGEGGRTADDSAGVIQAVIKYAFEGEYKKIADVLIAERSSYSRPDVIAACETVLNEIDSIPADPDKG
jgi:hypothetical protein